MTIAPKNKIILSIVVFVLISGILSVFLIYPIFNNIVRSSEEIGLKAGSLAELNQEAANLKNFQNFSKENRQDLDNMAKVLVDPENPVEFIEFMENQAGSLGLYIKIIPNAVMKQKGDPFPSMIFNLNVAGKFSNFMVFIERMETSNYLISTTALSIRRISDADTGRQEFKGLSVGDISTTLSWKVYTK